MKITLRPSGALNQDTFEGCASWEDSAGEEREVDLRRTWFFDPFAIVALLTLVTLWIREGDEVRLFLPVSRSARTYLARMRFFELLPPGILTDEPFPVVEQRAAMLVEVRDISGGGEQDVEELGNFVFDQLPPGLRNEFTDAIAEIGQNVVQHSRAPVAFLAAQRYEGSFQGRGGPRLHLVVADAGIGVKRSLQAGVPEVAALSDVDAILEALKLGVTGKPNIHSGVGLTTVAEYADTFRGVFRIRSGRGLVVRRRTGQRTYQVPWLPGTIVAVELASS